MGTAVAGRIDPDPGRRHFSSMQRKAVRLVIEGKVQGVGYRWWAVGEAMRQGVNGWVRNRSDGTVEALVIGREDAVARFERACRRGPAGAQVTGIARLEAEADGSRRFSQKPTV
jgi:acylphosphatase